MPSVGAQQPTALIALDWGTSSLRAYRLDGAGDVLELRSLPWGIMNLPPAPAGTADARPQAGFERAFDVACGDWLRGQPGLAVIACGMVGSAQGWREARYLEVPTSLEGLAQGLTAVPREAGPPLHIVPGLIERGALPNVMRGEETQVLGVLATLAPQPGEAILVGLPGTHSKWVRVQDGVIAHFDTFMTGEVFAALRGHTILGRTMQAGAPDDAAFDRGLAVAASPAGDLGLLSNIFSSRTLGLTGELAATAQADYLSGLLIGHEIACLLRTQPAGTAPSRIVLCGEADLCRRYTRALEQRGLGRPLVAQQATAQGLWRIAVSAGLVARAQWIPAP